MKNQVSVSIFGSCVSRDVIELDRQGDKKIELKAYIARQSIVTSIGKPILCCLEEIKLTSKWQQQVVYNDLSKKTFETLRAAKSDYCIIDLIDERFSIGKLNNSLITISNGFNESNYAKEGTVTICNRQPVIEGEKLDYIIEEKKLSWYMDQFIERLLEIYNERQIIFHVASFQNEYYTENGEKQSFSEYILKTNKEYNQLLHYMYGYLISKLSKSKVVTCNNSYLATELHKWGLAPMHYEKEYYFEILNQLYHQFI